MYISRLHNTFAMRAELYSLRLLMALSGIIMRCHQATFYFSFFGIVLLFVRLLGRFPLTAAILLGMVDTDVVWTRIVFRTSACEAGSTISNLSCLFAMNAADLCRRFRVGNRTTNVLSR